MILVITNNDVVEKAKLKKVQNLKLKIRRVEMLSMN